MNDQVASRNRTYESGDWYGVIGPNVVVILPPEEKGRVAAVWALADAGSGFDETLDALISEGLRDLHGFVLVSSSEGDTKVVIRGMARASFVAGGERVDLEGSQATTWVERSLRGVTSMVIEVAEVPDGTPGYTIEHGLVRIARLSEGVLASEAPAGELHNAEPGAPVILPETEELDEPAPIDQHDVAPLAGADPLSDPLKSPESVLGASEPVRPDEPLIAFGAVGSPDVDPWIDPTPAPVVVSESTFTTTPEEQPRAEDEPVSAPVDPEATELIEPLEPPADVLLDDGAGQDRDDDPAPQPRGAHAAGSWEGDFEADAPTDSFAAQDHDGTTHHSPWDEEELSLVRPGIPGQEPAPEVTARPVARLIISDGQRIDVDRVVILGRAPLASRFSETEHPLLVRVDSPNQEISSTHLEVRPGSGADHGTAVVTDLGSTNGTVVAQPGLDAEELQPGVSVQLIPGAIIDLGDGVTIQATRP